MEWLAGWLIYILLGTPYIAVFPGVFGTAVICSEGIGDSLGVGPHKTRPNYSDGNVMTILTFLCFGCMCVGPYVIMNTIVTVLRSRLLDEQGIQCWEEHPLTAAAIFIPMSIVMGFAVGYALWVNYVPYLNKDTEFTLIFPYVLCILLVFAQLITTVVLPQPIRPTTSSQGSEIEACNSDWVSSENISDLHYSFRGHLFGQHIAQEQLPAIMDGFFHDENPQRPLVLSFHGRTGTGKNHVSRLIAESIYKKGMASEFVHLKVPQRDYPDKGKLDSYKKSLQEEIHTSVAQCERQLFIFDEVEDLPDGLLNSIKPYLDYHDKLDGVDYKKSIFLFLSNVAGREISEILLNHNASRETLRIRNFEKVIEKVSFNAKDTGFSRSRLLDSHLISHYIPFLPLERQHVKLCIKEEAIKLGLYPVSEEAIAEIMEELQFWPDDTLKYAIKGCKNVREKVNLYAYSKKNSEL